ncbi:phytanoyl-CoA dioxygenase family protein [Asticcacaulis sp. AND118]|uniref:phytanoyl-CoA dioxygenase family protein n=1 Tax=Asticcacaulis sp. AND118 TaxID=2840468 RepID=UPI001CFFDF20|nr:phytanoyl-CoA dioxygenase family protein [Asticcacaulis sp. AND118]UDF02828.1 phytanoyl-CoA dioxygenase family protein [Asticcacaulis sp. AND118]
MTPISNRALSDAQVNHFIHQGFVRLDEAFPEALAEQGRRILWQATGCDPNRPETWTRPVVRLGHFSGAPFAEAANTPGLHATFDQLVGPGRWQPQGGLGTFPVRFPSPDDPGDTGWHIDVSFGTENPDFLQWRANIQSKGRALLMLFLFSDVGEADAPTRIRAGSHLGIARRLAPAGEAGLTLGELAATGFAESAGCEEVLATGPAGTVYLCHPFLVHSAQPHRGTQPRFMAQPPLLPTVRLNADGPSPVERAIALALG